MKTLIFMKKLEQKGVEYFTNEHNLREIIKMGDFVFARHKKFGHVYVLSCENDVFYANFIEGDEGYHTKQKESFASLTKDFDLKMFSDKELGKILFGVG